MQGPGTLYVISAPSGAGKTTLVKALIESLPNITVSISHTTRPKRPLETHGVNYYFVSQTEFDQMVQENAFLEHATVFNHSYGTSKAWVNETLQKGLDVILEIDWQGAQQIQHLFPESISIFILPPSLDSLRERLINRNQDKEGIIKQRLSDVREAVSHAHEYNYLVMNDHFETAVHDLRVIIEAGRLSESRQSSRFASLLRELKVASR